MRRSTLLVLTAWLAASACSERNRPPTIDALSDRNVVVATTLELVVRAADPDGDALEFRVDGKPPDADWVRSGKNAATLRWSPLVSDALDAEGRPGQQYPLTFIVVDSHGAWTSADVTLTVWLEAGAPVFQSAPGYVLNLAEQRFLTFVVEVKDDDSATVDLRMTEGIAGAVFETAGPKSAAFFWEPSTAQIAEGAYYAVTFAADDGEHAPVEQEVSLVLLNGALATDCAGQAPSLRHVPPPDAFGSAGIPIEVEAADPESALRQVTVRWALGTAPADDAFSERVLERVERSDRYRGTLPAPDPRALPAFVSYVITAQDNDDLAGERCDHAARLPKSGLFHVAVHPDFAPDACLQDEHEPDDAPLGTMSSAGGPWTALRLCPGDEDWFKVLVARGRSLVAALDYWPDHGRLALWLLNAAGEVIAEGADSPNGSRASVEASADEDRVVWAQVTAPAGDRLTYGLRFTFEEGGCPDDPLEPNGQAAEATPLALPAERQGLTLCPADEDWYALDLAADASVEVELDMLPLQADLDLAIVGPDGVAALVTRQQTGVVHEQLVYRTEAAGTYYLRVFSAEPRAGGYTLRARVQAGCADDALAPNGLPSEAWLLPMGAYEGLTVCPGTRDWFAYELNPDEHLRVVAWNEAASAPLTVSVLDGSGESLGDFTQVGETVEVDAPSPGAGAVFYGIGTSDGGQAEYGFVVAAEAAAGACRDDRLGPNGSAATALPLPHGYTTRLRLCAGQADWWLIEAAAGAYIQVQLVFFDDGRAPPVARLFAPDGETLLAESDTGPGEASLTAAASAGAGGYLVEVRAADGGAQEYEFGYATEP